MGRRVHVESDGLFHSAQGDQVSSSSACTHCRSKPSSRRRPQQINLPVTLHLDCINVELGPITAIGRTWQSLSSAVILASHEGPALNGADKAFSALPQSSASH